jgi:hypothetical protein
MFREGIRRKEMKKIFCFWILFLLTVVSAEAEKQTRSFYLTKGIFTGSHALKACAPGYHMASLWEIIDPSNFKYNTNLGATTDDSGFGPPTFAGSGWIRTGYVSYGSSDQGRPGLDNCFAWSSESSLDLGTIAGLWPLWSDPPSRTIEPWWSAALACSTQSQVWCVQD